MEVTQTPGVCDDLERRSTTPSASGASSAAGGGTVVMKQYDTPVKKGFGSPFFGACALHQTWRFLGRRLQAGSVDMATESVLQADH